MCRDAFAVCGAGISRRRARRCVEAYIGWRPADHGDSNLLLGGSSLLLPVWLHVQGYSGGPEYVLQYLGRHTHRVAISNHRLVSFADGPSDLSLARFGSSQRTETCQFVARPLPAPLPTASASTRFRAHPALRLPGVPTPCHDLAPLFSSCWERHKNRLTKNAVPPLKVLVIFIDVRSVEDQCGSSNGSALAKSHFVLLHRSALPHESTLCNTNTPRASYLSAPSFSKSSIPASSTTLHSLILANFPGPRSAESCSEAQLPYIANPPN
jgi:hypothetical protein